MAQQNGPRQVEALAAGVPEEVRCVLHGKAACVLGFVIPMATS